MIFEFLSKSPDAIAGVDLQRKSRLPQDAIHSARRWMEKALPQCSMSLPSLLVEVSGNNPKDTSSCKFAIDVVQKNGSASLTVGAIQAQILKGLVAEISMSMQSNALPALDLAPKLVERELHEVRTRLCGHLVQMNQAIAWTESFKGTLSQPAVLGEMTLVSGNGPASVSKSCGDSESYNLAVEELLRSAPQGAHVWSVSVGVLMDEGVLRLFGLARLRAL